MSLIIANSSSNPVPKNSSYEDSEDIAQRARERRTALKAIAIVIVFISIMCFILYYAVHYLQLKDQNDSSNKPLPRN